MERSELRDRFKSSPLSARKEGVRLIAVDRAFDDLRRGMPVVLVGGDAHYAVAAAERISDETIAWLNNFGGGEPFLVISAHRARTLKIKQTGSEAVAVRGSGHLAAADIATLVDPTADLDHPMRGPFVALQEQPGEELRAALMLNRLARLLPAAVMTRIGHKDDPPVLLESELLLSVSTKGVLSHETSAAESLVAVSEAHVPLVGAVKTRIIVFRPKTGGVEHLAIIIGEPSRSVPALVRLHSECFTGDLLGSLRCDCGQQLRGAVDAISEGGGGVLLYLAQEGRGIGLVNKLRAYQLQDQGYDTIDANQRLGFEADERIFLPAAKMLRNLGFNSVRLLTNNPHKVSALELNGIEVIERVSHSFPANDHNLKYLETKAKRSGHLL